MAQVKRRFAVDSNNGSEFTRLAHLSREVERKTWLRWDRETLAGVKLFRGRSGRLGP